jgi:hypothetical protein
VFTTAGLWVDLPTILSPKRGDEIEQLNIEGKRSGNGFVAHKDTLVNALSRALAERVILNDDVTLGRIEALRACSSGIVKLEVISPTSPMLFSVDGYRLVVMPIAIPESKAEAEDRKPKGKASHRGKGKAKEAEAVADDVAREAEEDIAEEFTGEEEREAVAV